MQWLATSVKAKINFIDNRKQQLFTPRPTKALGSALLTKAPLAQILPV